MSPRQDAPPEDAPLADATEMLRALGSGETTALAQLEACLARIHAKGPQGEGAIKSFITLDEIGARAAARASDARRAAGQALALDGLPFAVKDNIAVAGLPLTDGTGYYRHRTATQDAHSVARLKAAGAVLIGKLNLHEGALGATNDNPFWGQCQNPLRPGYTPGGSSGGSAAAVAAGFVPLSLGTDTMGSVRIPAAYCGLWGIKPGRGVISRHGLSHLSWTLDCIGTLARSARDLARVYPILAGFDPQDPDSQATTLIEPTAAKPRIGLLLQDPHEATPEVDAAFAALCARLRAAGYDLREVRLPEWHPGKLRRAGLLVSEAEGAHVFHAPLAADAEGLSAEFKAMLRYGKTLDTPRLIEAYAHLRATRAMVLQAIAQAEVDLLLLPTTPQLAFAHGTPVPVNQADHTALANTAGLPALAFPLPAASGALPASAQLIGPPQSDLAMIAWASSMAALT